MELDGFSSRLISLVEDELFSEVGDNHIFLRIAEIGRDAFQADFAVLFARNPTTGRFDPAPVVWGQVSEAERAHLAPPRPQGVSQRLVASRLLFVPDLGDESAASYRSAFTDEARIRSFAAAAMPATGEQEPLCILYLDYRSPHPFTDEEQADLRAFADQAALVLRSRLSFEGLRRVRQTGERLTRVLDSDDVLETAVTAIRDAAAADLVVLYPSDPQTRRLLPPVTAGELLHPGQRPRAEAGMGILSRVLEADGGVLLTDASTLYDVLGLSVDGNSLPFLEREGIRSLAALPLAVGDERVGALFVNFRRRQEMDASQAELIHGLSTYAAIAIRNSGVLRDLREQEVRRLELLRSIDREISGTLQLKEVLQATLALSAREVGADEASILSYDQEKGLLETVAAVGEHAERSRTQRISLSDAPGITRWVFQNRVPARVDDLRTDPVFGPLHVEVAPGIVSELDVPLLHNGQVRGVMNYESRRPAAFTQSHQEFLVTLAEHAVLAILNAVAYERERRTRTEREIMADLSSRIAARAPLGDVYELILEKALALTGATAGELMLVCRDRGELERVAGRGGYPDRRFQPLGQGIIGWVVEHGVPFDGDILMPQWKGLYRAELPDTQSEMTVPLLSGGEVIGVLDVESREPQCFTRHDLNLLQALTDLAVVAIRNADSEEQAEIQLRRFQVLHQAGLVMGEITGQAEPGAGAADDGSGAGRPDPGVEEAYDAVIQIAREHTGGEVVIRRFEPATRELVARAWAHVQDGEPFARMPVDGRSLNAQVFRQRRSFVVHDTAHPPPEVEAIHLSDDKTRTLLITPVQTRETYYGNLALAHAEPYHFLDTDLELFEGLANLLALTLHRLEMTTELRNAELRTTAAEAFAAMNMGAAHLAHRLKDAGVVPPHLLNLREALERAGALNDAALASVGVIDRFTRMVRTLGQSLRDQADAFRLVSEKKVELPLRALLQDVRNASYDRPESVRLRVDDAPHDGVMLRVVPGLVVNVLIELVSNAIQALGRAGDIEVRAEPGDETVLIHCWDSGEPIPPQLHETIFLPFHSTKGSSGMGLWMGRSVARAVGGSLSLSPSGPGNTFTLTLPRMPSTNGSTARPE